MIIYNGGLSCNSQIHSGKRANSLAHNAIMWNFCLETILLPRLYNLIVRIYSLGVC